MLDTSQRNQGSISPPPQAYPIFHASCHRINQLVHAPSWVNRKSVNITTLHKISTGEEQIHPVTSPHEN